MSEEVSERCVLLKSMPADIEARDVKTILDTGHGDIAYDGKYDGIHQHTDDHDVRWIVLFKSKEDADTCIKNGSWTTETSLGTVLVFPDLCSECIIPDEWTRGIPDGNQSSLLDDWVVTGTLEGEVPTVQTEEITQRADDARDSIKPEDLYPSQRPSEDIKDHDSVNKYYRRPTKITEDDDETAEHQTLEAPTGFDINFSSSEMFGSGDRLSGNSSISSSRLFGSGKQTSENPAISDEKMERNDRFSGNSSISSNRLFGSGNESSGSFSVKHSSGENINEDLEHTNISTADAKKQHIEIDSKQHVDTWKSEQDNTFEENNTIQISRNERGMATGPSYVTPVHTSQMSRPVHTMPINQQDMTYDYSTGNPHVTMPNAFDVKHGAPYMYGGQYPTWIPQMAYPPVDAQGAKERPSVMYVTVPVHVPVPVQVNDEGQYVPVQGLPGQFQGRIPYMPNLMYDQQGRQFMPMTGTSENKAEATNLQPGTHGTNAFKKEDNNDGPYCSMDNNKPLRPSLNTQESTASIDRFGYFKPGQPDNIYEEIGTSNFESSSQSTVEQEKGDRIERAGTRNKSRPLPSTPNEGQPTGNNKTIDVKRTSKLKILDISKETDRDLKLAEKEHCKIRIENIPKAVSTDTIERFFESPTRSGGGDIVSVDMKSKTGEAIIEFKEEQIVESVLKKQIQVGGFDFYRVKIVVSKYTAPVFDPLKLFVSNIAEKTSSESLLNFIEARCKVRPRVAITGDTPGTAMLVFPTKPDVAKLKSECKKKQLEDSYLGINEVEVTRSVKVRGLPKESSPEVLTFYFERKEIGGGEVEDTVYQSSSGCHIVTFRHAKDAKRVNEQGTHKVDNTHLSVDLYYKCMDLDPSLSFTIPEPLKFPDIDIHLIRFWSNNAPFKNKIEDEIRECFGRISWPEQTSDVCLTVHCDVDSKDRNGRSKIEKWKQECGKRVYKNKELFLVSEKIYVAQEVWIATTERLVDLNSKYAQNTTLFLKADEKCIIIVGTKSEAAKLYDEIFSNVTDLEQQLALENQPITKIRNLKVFQIAMVKASKFLEYLKKNGIRYKLDMSTREIELQGKKKEVDDALKKLEQTLQEYVKKRVSGFCKSAKDLLFERHAQSYIKDALSKKKCIGIWDVVRGEDLIVYSRSDSDLERACQIIRDCIKEGTIKLDPQMESLVNSQTGQDHVIEMTDTYKNQFKIDNGRGEIRLVCIDAIFDQVYKEIDMFIDLHRVIKEPLKVDPGKLRYIMQFKLRQLEDIEKQYSQLSVRIERIDTDKMVGFQLSGKKDGVRLAISKLQTIVDHGVFTKEHKLETPHIQTFIESKEGLQQCKKIEAITKCVLLIDRSFITKKEHRKSYEGGASNTKITACHVGKCEIIALLADLTSIQTDAIVIPTTPSMTNTIGLGAAIIEKGGREIQRECDAIRQARSVLDIGEVVSTKAGKLSCKAIFHAVVSTRTGDDSNDKKKLQKPVLICLEEAHKRRYESLALPVLGIGRFQYPAKQATEYIMEAFDMFLKKHGDATSLKKILICDKMIENVKELSNAMVKIFGEDISQVPHDDSMEDELFDEVPRRAVSQEVSPVKVEVVLGSLENQTVDVIVNSTNQNIDMNVGIVSKQLLKAGGDGLIKECQQNCPPKGLEVSDIIATSGGAMKCSAIYHGMINQWRNRQESENVLVLFVQNCLHKADRERFTSIAFPALGTGVLGFPAQVAARIMFNCASTFSGVHLRKVLFVVWSGSPETVKAFQDEERKPRQTERKLAARKSYMEEIISQPTNQPFTKTIEGLTIEIEQGDITKEKTDLIVNSTLKELDLNSGAVSKAILIAAGDTVQAECKGTQQRMINDGFVYTSAGRLFSKGIIHVKAKNNPTDWEKVVLMVMEYADKKGFNSISFPALGTGGKCGDPATVAKVMYNAFKAYSRSSSVSHCVKKVRVVIYQQDMVPIFKDAMDESKRRARRTSLLSQWFSSKKKEDEAVKCVVVFHIYSDSEHNLNKAQDDLDSLYQEDSLSLVTYAKQGLTPAQVQILKAICDRRHVTPSFDEKKGDMILQGYGNVVYDAKREIREFFKKK